MMGPPVGSKLLRTRSTNPMRDCGLSGSILPGVNNDGASGRLQTPTNQTHESNEGLRVVRHAKVRPCDVVVVGYVAALASLEM